MSLFGFLSRPYYAYPNNITYLAILILRLLITKQKVFTRNYPKSNSVHSSDISRLINKNCMLAGCYFRSFSKGRKPQSAFFIIPQNRNVLLDAFFVMLQIDFVSCNIKGLYGRILYNYLNDIYFYHCLIKGHITKVYSIKRGGLKNLHGFRLIGFICIQIKTKQRTPIRRNPCKFFSPPP